MIYSTSALPNDKWEELDLDNQLALVYNDIMISWFAIFTAIGCFIGAGIACLLRKAQQKEVSDIFIVITFGVPLGLALARVQYCLFPPFPFADMGQMLDITKGGFGLYGAMLGVFLSAVLARFIFRADGLGDIMDCMAIGGAAAITVGRFATFFSTSEIGYEVPFEALTVYNAEENLHVLAVYVLDGIYEAVILGVCLIFFFYCQTKRNRIAVSGKTALVMLAMHGTNQVVMDSMRADALKLGANEFIKISQIIGILCAVAVLTYFMVQVIKCVKFKKTHILSICVILACIVFGILSEYRVGNGNYISKHLMMLVCMLILDWLVIWYGLRSANPKIMTDAVLSADPLENKSPEEIIMEEFQASGLYEDDNDLEVESDYLNEQMASYADSQNEL